MGDKVIVVGDEYDSILLTRLIRTIEDIGGRLVSPPEEAIGGSQDLCIWTFLIDSSPIAIESETYVGLTLRGDERVVDLVVSQLSSN